MRSPPRTLAPRLLALLLLMVAGCATAPTEQRSMLTTAYCPCGECNGYERGRWRYLKLDVWNRYLTYGSQSGQKYTGATAGGHRLVTPRPGLFSGDSLERPWMIPVRILLPWRAFPRKGTIAADTDYYPFGTVMHVPGWGTGIVDDVGGAIKGPERLDLMHRSHRAANRWGRQRVTVTIEYPE